MSLGSEIRKKLILDPGSRGQKGTGSRISDPDPQHWFTEVVAPYSRQQTWVDGQGVDVKVRILSFGVTKNNLG
jgi:hypothetical protein